MIFISQRPERTSNGTKHSITLFSIHIEQISEIGRWDKQTARTNKELALTFGDVIVMFILLDIAQEVTCSDQHANRGDNDLEEISE